MLNGSSRARAAPLEALRGLAGAEGWLRELGARHLALFRPAGGTLLVEFDGLATLARRAPVRPWSDGLMRSLGWSTLTVAASGRTWFRDGAVHDFFDGLTDGGFFDGFDSVLFLGAGVRGYAAGAFSVAAPGATVLLLAPYATLDPALVPWERRFLSDRALPFGPRYGYAPDMIDASARAYVVSDPHEAADAMHASLFRGPGVLHLRAPHAGPRLGARLDAMGLVEPLAVEAEAGTLTPLVFAQHWRARRSDAAWLSAVLTKLGAAGRPWLEAVWAAAMLDATGAPRARSALADARDRLAQAGLDPPPRQAGPRDRALLAGE